MRAVTMAALLLASLIARAEEQKEPPKDQAKPEAHILSEKELVDDDKDYKVRLSLPTEDDVKAWASPGLRIGLAYGHGHFWGTGPAQALTIDAFTLRVLARLDQYWSVGLDFQYAKAGGSPLSGLRFGSTAQVVMHPWRQLGLGLGIGYGGLVLTQTSGVAIIPGNGNEVADTTFDSNTKMGACSGGAWVGLFRAEYLFVVGPMFSTGPYVESDTQLTQCQQTLGRVDHETGNPIYGRQWWLNQGATVGWWFTWR